jgi:hypothetical protein
MSPSTTPSVLFQVASAVESTSWIGGREPAIEMRQYRLIVPVEAREGITDCEVAGDGAVVIVRILQGFYICLASSILGNANGALLL